VSLAWSSVTSARPRVRRQVEDTPCLDLDAADVDPIVTKPEHDRRHRWPEFAGDQPDHDLAGLAFLEHRCMLD
jgi:hypothetical protein